MNYNESSEDYLEAILMLREQLGKVRSIDIVYKLGYSKPSISIAMKKLREKGLISMDTTKARRSPATHIRATKS